MRVGVDACVVCVMCAPACVYVSTSDGWLCCCRIGTVLCNRMPLVYIRLFDFLLYVSVSDALF